MCRRQARPADCRRRVHGVRGPVRVWQDDRAANGRRPRGHQQRCRPDRRAYRERSFAEEPRHRHGLPELRAVSPPECSRQHRVSAEDRKGAEGRDPPAGRRCGADPRSRAVPRTEAAGAFGRSAAAGGDGPRDRSRAGRLPVGRAAVEPGREAPSTDARRHQEAPARSGYDDRVRHTRSGRGDDDGRPRRSHAQRGAAAGRAAAGALRPSDERIRRRFHRQPGDEHARGAGGAGGRRPRPCPRRLEA